MKNKRFKVCIYIIIMATSIAILIALIRLLLIDFLHMSDAAATTLMTIGQVVAGAVGAIMIFIQLARESDVQEEQANIQEAQFILEYNRAFIQDANMTYVEQQLEESMKSGYKDEIINDENRQMFINYLVYLEGMAPLILNDVLQLDHIDDLMAYRFFLAVNNKEVQEKELMYFPDFYKGCFKLYTVWKRYRLDRGYMILQEKQSLDKWLEYEKYIDSKYMVRNAQPGDAQSIAEILYGTDPYIYPAAFKSAKEARTRFSLLINLEGSVFHYSNIKVAIDQEGKTIGAICCFNNAVSDRIDYYSALGMDGERTKHVCVNYFSHLAGYTNSENIFYIAAICVLQKHRGNGVGKMLLKNMLAEHHDRTIKLDVLCDNKKAIELYKENEFVIEGESHKGYSYPPEEKPDCYSMVRYPSNNWIINKFV